MRLTGFDPKEYFIGRISVNSGHNVIVTVGRWPAGSKPGDGTKPIPVELRPAEGADFENYISKFPESERPEKRDAWRFSKPVYHIVVDGEEIAVTRLDESQGDGGSGFDAFLRRLRSTAVAGEEARRSYVLSAEGRTYEFDAQSGTLTESSRTRPFKCSRERFESARKQAIANGDAYRAARAARR